MSNIWKRSLSLLLAVVMVAGMVPMGVFATEQEECAHTNVEYIDEPADCVWEGYYAEYCLDCETYLHEELIPANGHSWEGDVCTACGETQTAEEPEDEASDEAVEEDDEEELVVDSMEDPAAFVMKNADLTGIVWLDKNRDGDLMTKVMDGGLREMVLTAVGMHGSSQKVYYNSEDGSKKDVSSLMDLALMYEELKDVLTGSATLYFTIGNQVAAVELLNINNVSFDVYVPAVEYAGEPEDLAAEVEKALNDSVISAYYSKNTPIDWEALPEAQCAVTYNKPGNYTWPHKTEAAQTNASVTITLKDSVDGKTVISETAKVGLVDTTPVWTVQFISNGVVHESFDVIDGENLTETVGNPVRAYYTFAGWDAEVVTENIKASATYTALWTPVKDANGNGVADQEEYFNVVYMVDGEEYKTFSQKYGSATKLPEEDPTKDGHAFLTWVPAEDVNGLVDETVTRDMTYVAKWLENEEFVVIYTLKRIGGTDLTFKMMTVNGMAIDKDFDDAILDGWKHNGEAFDFSQKVTAEMAPEGVLYLTGTLGYNVGGNEYIDGTAEDPYINYVFQTQEGENWVALHEPDTYFKSDDNTKVDIQDIDMFWHPDTLNDDVIHVGWTEQEPTGDQYSQQIALHPAFTPDINNNRVPDEGESAKIFIAGNGTVEGLENEQEFLYNSKYIKGAKNNEPTVIVAKPDANYYVAAIKVNGMNVAKEEHYDKSTNTYTIDLTALNLVPVMATAEDDATVAYKIEVEFAAAEIHFKDTVDLKAGMFDGENRGMLTEAYIYNAVVEEPVVGDDDTVTAKYVARKSETVKVNVKALYNNIVHRYGKLGEEVLKKVWPGDTIEVVLTKVEKPVTYQHVGMVKTPQQIVDSYILEQQNADIKTLLTNVAGLKLFLTQKLNDTETGANIRPFLYNENGTSFEETIIVSYQGNGQYISGEKTYENLVDDRAETSITAGKKTFEHGSFTDADLLKGVTLNGAEGAVALADSYAGRDAMTYNATAYYAGDDKAQPCQATFELKVQKRASSLTVDNVIVEKHNDSYNAAPTVTPADLDVISVVAGLDLNELDLDVALHGDPNAYLKNIKAKAWISLPDNLKSALELLGTDLSKTYDVSEIKGIVEKADALLDSYGVSSAAVDNIIKLLQKVEDYGVYNYADASMTMDVVFSDNVYPSNPGVYVNLAVTADPNYYTSYDYGTILIAPVVALPNRGGVQLTLNGLAENLFIEPSNGQPKALTVTYNGTPVQADVFYYGLHAELGILSGTKAPSLPGVYLASTIYTAKNADGTMKKLGSDAALIVIGLTEVDLDVESKIVEFGADKYYKPDVTVTDKHGNVVNDAAVTMISGSVGVENDEDLGLDDLTSDVNIAFPDAVHNAWAKFAKEMNEQSKVDLPELPEVMADAKITVDTFEKFVNWCDAKLNGSYNDELVAGLNKVKFPEKYIDNVERYFNATMDKLQYVSGELEKAADKLYEKTPSEILEITFKKWSDMSFHDKGVYFFYGIVTDPDYTPASNAGVMIIKAPDDAMVWLDTHTPYDGTEKMPEGWDTTERDSITMVVDKKAKEVNFLLDNHMEAVIDAFEKETGKTLNGLKVSALYETYEDGTTYAEKLVSKICSTIKEKAIDRIKSKTPGVVDKLADDVLEALDKKLGNLRSKLDAKLLELKDSDVTIRIEADLPVNVGTYYFYSYSYAIEVAYAELVIEPIYVRITAPNLEKEYDGQGVDTLEPVISYYSFKYLEGQTPKEVEMSKPAGLTVSYNIGCIDDVDVKSDWAVGEYPITITGAKVNNTQNGHKTVDVKNGTLNIVPRVVEVKASDADKFFGDKDPSFKWEFVSGSEVKPGDLNLEAQRAVTGEDVGQYDLKVVELVHNPNYTVELSKNNGKLTIKQAEIKITIKDVEKCFDEADPAYTYDYEVINGFGDADKWTDAEIRKYIEETLKLEIKRDPADDGKDVAGEEIALVAADPSNANVKVTVVPGKVVNTLGDYVCWNTATEVYYDDVTEALSEAESGQTVQMLKDATADTNGKNEEIIIVYNGLTFDLNGFYVETENLLSYGVVMDSLSGTDSVIADDGLASGGILIDVDTTNAWTQLQTENGGYMPIYDTVTGSYKFFAGQVQSSGALAVSTNEVQFWYKILTDEAEGYLVLHRTEDSNMKSVLNMNWTGMSGFGITYTMNDDTVKTYAGNAYNAVVVNGHNNQGLFLHVRGIQKLGTGAKITCQPTVQTDAEYADNAAAVITHTVK